MVLDCHFGVEGTTEGLFWLTANGIIMMDGGRGIPEDREAVHPKWLPPVSLCVHFGIDFALKSGLHPQPPRFAHLTAPWGERGETLVWSGHVLL